MNPERFQKISQLYHAALDLPRENRLAILAGACSGEQALGGPPDRASRGRRKPHQVMSQTGQHCMRLLHHDPVFFQWSTGASNQE